MLYSNVAQLVRDKSHESPGVFLRKHGFSSREVRTLLQKGGMVQVRDTMMHRLCVALRCTPNDIFCWKGDNTSHLRVLSMLRHWSTIQVLAPFSQKQINRILAKAQKLAEEKPSGWTGGEGRLFLNVPKLMEQWQQWHPQTYLVSKGFSWMEVSKLFDPKRKSVRVSMLTRLCEKLGCMPNDLYDWEGSSEHSLNALRKEKPFDLKEYLASLSPAEARQVVAELMRRD